jgi:hypothetical protein
MRSFNDGISVINIHPQCVPFRTLQSAYLIIVLNDLILTVLQNRDVVVLSKCTIVGGKVGKAWLGRNRREC